MTEVQRAYLMGRRESFLGNTGTHMYLEFKFRGDVKEFEEAFNKVIMAQPMLRAKVKNLSTFEILDEFYYEISNHILEDKNKYDNYRNQRRKFLSHKLYDYKDFPFYTIETIRNCEDKNSQLVLFSIDLLIADGLSIFSLFDQLSNLLSDKNHQIESKEELLFEINDYYFKEKESKRYLKDKDYWMKKLVNLPSAPNLFIDESKVGKSNFSRLEAYISKEDSKTLMNITKNKDISLNSLLLTMYGATLQNWSENDEFIINMTTFKRPNKKKYLDVIGDFTSTVLVEVNIQQELNIVENCEVVHNKVLKSFLHSKFEGIEIIRELNKFNENTIMPYVFTSMLFDFESYNDLGSVDFWISETPQVYLDCQIKKFNGEVHISWDYLEEVFDKEQIFEMFNTFMTHIKYFIEDYRASMKKVNDELNADVFKKYLRYNSNTNIITNPTQSILKSFYEIISLYPNKVSFGDRISEITFSELNKESDIIKNKIELLKNKDNLNKIRIGIVGHKIVKTVINFLGVMKCADSFCFIAPNMPPKRYQKLLDDNDISIVIDGSNINCIQPNIKEIPNHELYVVFTSGTTGTPKGICISEKSVLNTIDDIITRTNFTSEEYIFNVSDLTFDLSIFDLIAPLITGCKTFLCENQMMLINNLKQIKRATFWNSTPGLVNVLLNINNINTNNIRTVLMSGDFISIKLIDEIKDKMKNNQLDIWSLGGATEASIWSIYHNLNEFNGERVPYGKPLSNQKYFVMDENDKLVNSFVVGELIISGTGLADGYVKLEDNDKIFYKHDTLGDIYRTGDKGYLGSDNLVYILGRINSDLKLNGYRVDLKEIERCILNIENIENVHVMIVKDSNDKGSLICFCKTNDLLNTQIIRKNLKEYLPQYMIPTIYIVVEEIPLTVNGKIDTEKLLNLYNKNSNKVEPISKKELELLNLWSDVIGENFEDDNIFTSSTFFQLGGDSIKLPELLENINRKYKVNVSIEEIFDNFTLQEQAMYLEQIKESTSSIIKSPFLTKVKNGTTNKNIVLIHAGSGEVGIYNSLIRKIDSKYSVYAIRFDKSKRQLVPKEFDFKELANEYNSYLKEFESIDYIGGWCIGGTLGYEICKINSRIKNLLLINTLPPVSEEKQVFDFSFNAESQFIEKSFGVKFEYVNNNEQLWDSILNVVESDNNALKNLISVVPKELSRLIPFFGENDPRELIYYINLFRSFETTRMLYTSGELINQNIMYIGARQEIVSDYKIWKNLTSQSWAEFEVNGDHTTIFDEPNVFEMAAIINDKTY